MAKSGLLSWVRGPHILCPPPDRQTYKGTLGDLRENKNGDVERWELFVRSFTKMANGVSICVPYATWYV